MKTQGKVILTVAVVVALALALISAQVWPTRSANYNLDAKQMELLVSEILPPAQQQQLAANPEQKKQLAQRLRELLAIAQVAEMEGFAEREDVKSQIALQSDIALRETYEKKNPDAKVTDEEVAAYHQSHPTEWNAFLDANPQFKTNAQGAQGEGIKKEFGQIKLLADRARQEGLDKGEAAKIRIMIERSQALARAYVGDLQKNADKLVTDSDVEKYYNEHKDEFQEAKVRHILISTQEEHSEDDGHGHGKADAAKDAKGLTKEQARQKAQGVLDRVRKGEDFARLAQEFSDDPGSKDKGGLYDFFPRGTMVPEFENAAFTVKPGEISDLVETEYGYHIIKVEEQRTAMLTDQATRQKIVEKLKQEKLENRIKEIADSSSVRVAEDFEVKVSPTAPPPPMQGTTPPEAPQEDK
jgi:peptidyl-prolyl cis-trans isomerase C